MENAENKKRLMEQFGIMDEENIVSLADLEEREEIDICQVLLVLSWNTDRNW